MSATRITGGCQCGAVRYALNAPLGRASICHCRMCQKAFGSLFAPLVAVPFSAFELTRGTLSTFESSDAECAASARIAGRRSRFDIFLAKTSMSQSVRSTIPRSPGRRTRTASSRACRGSTSCTRYPAPSPKTTRRRQRYALIRRTNRQHPDHDTARWPPEGAVR